MQDTDHFPVTPSTFEQELQEAVAAWQSMVIHVAREHDDNWTMQHPLAAKLYEALTEPPLLVGGAPSVNAEWRTIRPWASYGEGALYGVLHQIVWSMYLSLSPKLGINLDAGLTDIEVGKPGVDLAALRAVRQAMKEA